MKPIKDSQSNSVDQDIEEFLNQLEDIVLNHSISDTSNSTNQESSENTHTFDLAAWEDAIADIEQYLEQKNK
ncbi:MAG: hypothetical protein HEQ20_09320 [Aphanizomenon flos-aquae KM1D3_PB]|uniref:Uncharacterized protein n=2 Tax=Cyanophyceae TaxID=3028117 RepID=A0ACC7S7Q9_DOLFA|nr:MULTISPECIES: hypothetical protein [Nostocales]KHG43032.1 hypothetical protein OA07_01295 [Aphanizomenon flos-aquae 2012/KM1/D3]MBO1066784.1 hypothetical protein [Anabaena sp. 54]MTJ29158.1 hypothetical protein [Aphanizomenon sp. UHCC 0183]OBQ22874.1 MAG: hypothetical protein AN486_01460 [Anabaena sp. AL93]QSV74246.1 MAG: hypothetical protein HEQ20_09320 [Aphanizomenon flos-aquae KM1D3_PB]